MKRLAVIRIRGSNNIKPKALKALDLMNLRSTFSCVVLKDSAENLGSISLIKDFITWGEINKDAFVKLLSVRGRVGNKKLTEPYLKEKSSLSVDKFAEEFLNGKKELKDVEGLNKYFRLSPPIKGFENKGIKRSFNKGGAIGYRGDKINELLERMI